MLELLGGKGYFSLTEVAKRREQKLGDAGGHLCPHPRGVCPRVKAPQRKEELRDSNSGCQLTLFKRICHPTPDFSVIQATNAI